MATWQVGRGTRAPHILCLPCSTNCRAGEAPGDALDGSGEVREATEGGQVDRE